MKKKKRILAAGGVCIIILLVVVILAVFLHQPKEIDQKVLFIYRQVNSSMGGVDEGYYIDNQGNKIEYDLTTILESRDCDRDEYRLLEILNDWEGTEGTPVFSAKKLARLYRYAYRIDAEQKIELEQQPTLYRGRHSLFAVRYKEDGEPEIIQLFQAGNYYGENLDYYAQKIKTALLQKNPIWVH